jgi:hypothetical protein
VPEILGTQPATWTTGKEYFEGLSDEEQIGLIGTSKWDAWQAGDISLDDLAQKSHSDEWGDAPRIANMSELGITRGGSEE